jgi:hypothetical protein
MPQPIEGTILTEGQGVGGSRTRGGHAERRPQSRSLRTGGAPTKLSAIGINIGNLGRVNTSGARLHAGRETAFIKDFAKEIPAISNQSIAQVGSMMESAAMNFANRKAIATADEAVVYYNDSVRKAFFGDPDNKKSGYKDELADNAVARHKEFVAGIEKTTADVIASLPEDARMKAMSRIQGARQVALNRGAEHVVKQQKAVEDNNRIMKYEDMTRELVVTSGASLFNEKGGLVGGTYDRVLAMESGDVAKTRGMVDAMVLAAARKRYLSDIETGRPGEALSNLKTFRDTAKNTITINAQSQMDDFVIKSTKSLNQKMKDFDVIAKREKKEKHDVSFSAASNYLAGYDARGNKTESAPLATDAGALKSKFPELSDKDAQKIVDTNAARLKKGSNVVSDTVGFHEEIRAQRAEGGYFIERSRLEELGLKYNMKPAAVNSAWSEGRKIIGADQKHLDTEVHGMFQELNRSFSQAAEASGVGASTDPLSQMGQLFAKSAKRGEINSAVKHDRYFNRLKTDITSISLRTDLTPVQKSKEIRDYMEAEVKKKQEEYGSIDAGGKNQLESFSYDMGALTRGYRVEQYMNQRKTQDQLGTESTPTEAAGIMTPEDSYRMNQDIRREAFFKNEFGTSPDVGQMADLSMKLARKGYTGLKYVENTRVGNNPSYTGMVAFDPTGNIKAMTFKGNK